MIFEGICDNDEIKVDNDEYNSILSHSKTPLERWWRNKKRENMTPEMLREWLQRAKTEYYNPVVNRLFKICTKHLNSKGTNFSDSAISRLQVELSNKSAVHLTSDALTHCCIQLLDCLQHSKRIFVSFESLQCNTSMLLHA